MKKKILGLAMLPFLLTACASASTGSEEVKEVKNEKPTVEKPREGYGAPRTTLFEQKLPDGRTVLCVWAADAKQGGLSCDWESLSKPQ